MWSGNTYTILRGHYECVNSCWFNQHDQVCSRGGGPFSFPTLPYMWFINFWCQLWNLLGASQANMFSFQLISFSVVINQMKEMQNWVDIYIFVHWNLLLVHYSSLVLCAYTSNLLSSTHTNTNHGFPYLLFFFPFLSSKFHSCMGKAKKIDADRMSVNCKYMCH